MTQQPRMALLLLGILVSGCAQKRTPAAQPTPPPDLSSGSTATATLSQAAAREEQPATGSEVIREETISTRALEDLNRDSPFAPVFYGVDSSELDAAGRMTVASNAQILRTHPTWAITVEGHCDERGTAEYNIALGEQRAVSVTKYLVSLGIASSRILNVSYGKEYPFDAAHNDEAWARNRRAHFVITSK